ncbi:MAG: Uncharacterized protein XD91_0134 [Clostridiales bacterium 38_11]|nr:MAG: Uncharacterized protein XD91_0134 [Clostridiales bacterium 38_11]HBH11654.1 hypothetical protein [Clostridiales bacterium]
MSEEFYAREVLKKKRKSTAFFIVTGFLSIIVLNNLITLTNKLASNRNLVSIGLIIVFGIMIFLLMERYLSVYVYKIGKDTIIFAKKTGNREHDILTVNLDEVINMKDFKAVEPNSEVRETYYFIYRDMEDECKVCEFKHENKLYRFVFSPSERILRILDRKLDYHGHGRPIKKVQL